MEIMTQLLVLFLLMLNFHASNGIQSSTFTTPPSYHSARHSLHMTGCYRAATTLNCRTLISQQTTGKIRDLSHNVIVEGNCARPAAERRINAGMKVIPKGHKPYVRHFIIGEEVLISKTQFYNQ